MSRRVVVIVVVALVAAGGALLALGPQDPQTPEGPEAMTMDQMARQIGAPVMRHVYLGHVPDRSGEIMLVPKPNNYMIGDWDLTTLGTDTPTTATSHPNPWNYLTRVPIIMYGPGYVPRGRVVFDEVDISAIAPTYAALLGMKGFESDGTALPAITDFAAGSRPPKAIFSVVIDGGGWNVLQQQPDSWQFMKSLMSKGTTYVNATIGSAPSITAALHATFGTGYYPIHHGIPGNQMRAPDGSNIDTWLEEEDPRYLEKPTVSELWDEQNDNHPEVATVSFEGWHLGMIGHGAQREGGDRDVAVTWEVDNNEWQTNEDYYTLPGYLRPLNLALLKGYERRLDGRDGLRDGLWFGHSLEELQDPHVRPGTPAFVRFTGDAAAEVIRRENIGTDDLTDLMWIEIKAPDFAGHLFNMLRPEEGDVLRETDRQIARFKAELDRQVGPGNYVFMISADHGQQPLPDVNAGWRINNKELERDINDEFGDVVQKMTPVDMYLDFDRMNDLDVTADDVVAFISTYTTEDNLPDNAPGRDRVPEARLDDTLFAGAFTTDYLESLTAGEIDSLGDGLYPQGDFTIDRAEGG